jgi:4-amino-4-deoxy-L-arabinose transferase-like glycosyltransferase
MRPEETSGLSLRLPASGYLFVASQRKTIVLWVGLGVLWGLIALSNASLLLCLPAMMVWIAWPELREWRLERKTIAGAVLTCVAFAAVLAPWMVRNERVMHALVLTRSNLGVELYESTLERNDGFPWGTTVPLWTGDPEYRQYVRMGEIPFAKMRGEEAKARIEARPGRTARWTLDRFLFFWDGTPHPAERHPVQEYLRQLSYCFLSVCGLLGLGLMLRRRVEGAGLFALIFLLLPLPYYLVTVQPRFRHPMEPLIAVLAVFLFRSTEKKRIESRGL